MGACADALRELRGIADRLNALDAFGGGRGLENEQVNLVRLIKTSPCGALKALAQHVQYQRPEQVLLAWEAMVVNGLEPEEPTLTKVADIRRSLASGPVWVISTSQPSPSVGEPMNPWIGHAREVVAVLIARVNRVAHTEGGDQPTVSVSPDLVGGMIVPSAGDDNGMFTVSDLAERFAVKSEPLRKRLDRWREKNVLSRDLSENDGATSREAKYLYRLGAVRSIIEDLKASGEASGERPAKQI